jgi:hypothetical protein
MVGVLGFPSGRLIHLFQASSDMDLIDHLLSEAHLKTCKMDEAGINFAYLREELEKVDECPDESTSNNEPTPPISTLNKKLRNKIKQKLDAVPSTTETKMENISGPIRQR